MSLAHDAIEARPLKARSRVSNGSALFADAGGVDGRSAEARRYRDLVADLSAHIGGEPTSAELAVIRRAASIAVWCEKQEATFVAGGELGIAEFTTATNALRRLLTDLGLQRRAKDVTPDLGRYLASKGRARA